MTTAAQILAVAKREVGYVERAGNWTKYAPAVGHANNQPWCATYVVWVFQTAGAKGLLPNDSAYTPTSYQGFVKAGQAVKGSMRTSLQPGDVVYFEWPGKGRIAHIAIFSHYDAKGAWCYEGNTNAAGSRTGGEVLLKHRKHGLITHAGRPKYGKASSAPVAAPAAPVKEVGALTPDDRKFIQDLFRIVLKGETADKKKTGHANLADLQTQVKSLTERITELEKGAV